MRGSKGGILDSPKPVNAALTRPLALFFFNLQGKRLHLSCGVDKVRTDWACCPFPPERFMKIIRQHISIHLQRVYRAVLPGGSWHLGEFFAEVCQAEPVAVRVTKRRAMPCRVLMRGDCKA